MMKERNRKGRLRILALAAALAAMSAEGLPLTRAPVVYAAENQASAMQLAKTEGTVKIKSGSDKNVPLREDMRLYNGYKVATTEKSYAWIELDRVKMAKLDAVSDASIRKNGKKLEILVNSGNIFFNVTEPLKDDESLNIRTATMVAGIRGTSGWVEITDEKDMKISVLEGKVELNVTDPVTGQSVEGTVSGGETAICSISAQAAEGGKCEIQRETLTQESINGFILQEVATDPALAEKILEKGGMDLRNVTVEEAQARLATDEEKVQKKVEETRVALSEQSASVSTGTVWAEAPATVPVVTPVVTPVATPVVTPAPAAPTPAPAEPEKPSYQVAFDTRGGSAIPGQTVVSGNPAGEPAMPARTGYRFTGWFTDAASTERYDFSRAVTGTLTLYAGWEKLSYAVTFDAKGGTAVPAQTVEYGNRATLPTAPGRTGYRFTGWFTGAGEAYSFDKPVTEGMTLYAGWEKLSYTVRFKSSDGVNDHSVSKATYGDLVNAPDTTPKKTGYDFEGWYTDNTYAEKYDFTRTAVTKELVLYPGWKKTLSGSEGADAVQMALNEQSLMEVSFPGTGTLAVGNGLAIPKGKTLTVAGGIENAATSTITVEGALNCGANIVNKGILNVGENGSVVVSGGENKIDNGADTKGTITNKGTIRATVDLGSWGILNNYGIIDGGENPALSMQFQQPNTVTVTLGSNSVLTSRTSGNKATVEYIGTEQIGWKEGSIIQNENEQGGLALLWDKRIYGENVDLSQVLDPVHILATVRAKTPKMIGCYVVDTTTTVKTVKIEAFVGWKFPDPENVGEGGWYILQKVATGVAKTESATQAAEVSALTALFNESALTAPALFDESDLATPTETESTVPADTTEPVAPEDETKLETPTDAAGSTTPEDRTEPEVTTGTTELATSEDETKLDISTDNPKQTVPTDATKPVASEEEAKSTDESAPASSLNGTVSGETPSPADGNLSPNAE